MVFCGCFLFCWIVSYVAVCLCGFSVGFGFEVWCNIAVVGFRSVSYAGVWVWFSGF